jgi:hypothetical protein
MKRLLLGAVGLIALGTAALAGGQFTSDLPGQGSYGPLTGSETIPVDTNLTQGAQPQTIALQLGALNLGGWTNKLVGGDFSTNPAQRLSTAKGVTALATLSPTAAVIGADRWWTVAPAAGVTLTIDSTASSAVVPGLNNTKAYRIARTSSGAAGIVCTGQTLDAKASAPFIGQQAVFSFYEFNGSTMSATNGQFTVNIDYTSAADGAATQATLGYAGLNGSKFALADAGTLASGPTNYINAVNGISVGTGNLVAGVSTTAGAPNTAAVFAGSTSWTRYGVYASIPTNVPGTTTAVTSVSVSICWTPTATTAVATDYIEIEGAQLEVRPPASTLPTAASGTLIGSTAIGPASTPVAAVANVPEPSPLERRPSAVEQTLAYYYWYFNYEQQSLGLTVNGSCENVATSTANCVVTFPVPMRLAPALQFTAGFQAFAQVAETSVSACTANSLSTSLASFSSNTGLPDALHSIGWCGWDSESMDEPWGDWCNRDYQRLG